MLSNAFANPSANPTFFVFSDDIAFCRENLPASEDYVFVDHNGETEAHEDLRLMSVLPGITSSRTAAFSWWGAWLNPNSDKIVLTPDRWLDPNVPSPDLLPPSWQRIPTEGPFLAFRAPSQPIAS